MLYVLKQLLGPSLRTPPGRRSLLAVTILTCALAITSAMFAVVDALWLRPLPFVQPDRLVSVSLARGEPGRGMSAGERAEMLEALASDPRVAASARAVEGELSERYGYEVGAQGLYNYRVTPSFFNVLGVAPTLGRSFVESDGAHADILPAVVAYSIWRSRWGGDPAVIGRVVRLGDTRVQVVGVMPAGFTFPSATTLWTPLPESDPLAPSVPSLIRLADHGSLTDLRRTYPLLDLVPLEEYYRPQQHAAVTLIAAGSSILFAAVVLTLVSLRAIDLSRRVRDEAIRTSLGATPWRIAIDTGARVAVLTAVALAVAWIAVPALVRLTVAQLPPELFRHTEVLYTWRTGTGSLVLALAGALAFHWPASIGQFQGTIGHPGIVRQGLPSHAMAVACLVAAGAAVAYVAVLATVSTGTLERSALGFEPGNVLEVSFPRRLPGENHGRATAFRRWLDVGDLPGVVSTALAAGRPLRPSFLVEAARVPGNPACGPVSTRVNYVTPDYFRTIGVRIREGEAFSSPVGAANEGDSSAGESIFELRIVANEALMRRLRPCGATLGTRLQLALHAGTIVAIAENAIDRDPREPSEPQVYLPVLQDSGSMLLVKHASRGERDERFLMQALAIMFPGADVAPLSADVARAQRADRSRAYAMQLFCGLSILLAALGLLANQTALLDTRRREMALRLALGANLPHLRRRIIMPSALGALAGGPVGVLIGIACGRIGESLLVGVSAVYLPGLIGVPVIAATMAVSVAVYGARVVRRLSPASVLNESS